MSKIKLHYKNGDVKTFEYRALDVRVDGVDIFTTKGGPWEPFVTATRQELISAEVEFEEPSTDTSL